MARGGRPKRIQVAHSSIENECNRCGEDILDWAEATKTRSGKFVHKTCAGGGDDE